MLAKISKNCTLVVQREMQWKRKTDPKKSGEMIAPHCPGRRRSATLSRSVVYSWFSSASLHNNLVNPLTGFSRKLVNPLTSFSPELCGE
jgi:hypothetical protein